MTVNFGHFSWPHLRWGRALPVEVCEKLDGGLALVRPHLIPLAKKNSFLPFRGES